MHEGLGFRLKEMLLNLEFGLKNPSKYRIGVSMNWKLSFIGVIILPCLLFQRSNSVKSCRGLLALLLLDETTILPWDLVAPESSAFSYSTTCKLCYLKSKIYWECKVGSSIGALVPNFQLTSRWFTVLCSKTSTSPSTCTKQSSLVYLHWLTFPIGPA